MMYVNASDFFRPTMLRPVMSVMRRVRQILGRDWLLRETFRLSCWHAQAKRTALPAEANRGGVKDRFQNVFDWGW